jgi:hypothetical protein
MILRYYTSHYGEKRLSSKPSEVATAAESKRILGVPLSVSFEVRDHFKQGDLCFKMGERSYDTLISTENELVQTFDDRLTMIKKYRAKGKETDIEAYLDKFRAEHLPAFIDQFKAHVQAVTKEERKRDNPPPDSIQNAIMVPFANTVGTFRKK